MSVTDFTAIAFVYTIISLISTNAVIVQNYNCSSLSHSQNTIITEPIITDQRELDEFIQDSIVSNSRNATRCVHLSLVGDSFKLDLLQLMRINLGTNGSLMITGNSVIISCTTNVTDLEELRDILQPISRALLVLLDGLVFTRCPVPIVIEEMSTVIIQNCVFL